MATAHTHQLRSWPAIVAAAWLLPAGACQVTRAGDQAAQSCASGPGSSCDGGASGRGATTSDGRDAAQPDARPPAADPPDARPTAEEETPAQERDAASDAQATAPEASPRHLPCEVAKLLERHCARCHGEQRRFGAPMSLTTWEELLAPSPTQSELSSAEHASERVRSATAPMPPAPYPRLDAAELATLTQWVEAGSPAAHERCDLDGAAEPEPPVELPMPEDCDAVYELRAHGGDPSDADSKFQIGAQLDDRQYQCFYFAAPHGDDAALYWHAPILDNVEHLHHFILYTTDELLHEPGSAAPCNPAEPGAHFVAGWGPGMESAPLPSDVALNLETGPGAGLILELHYFNTDSVPREDASGVRFCTGPREKRAHLAGVHTTGSEGICLEPGATREVAGVCNPRTDLGDIHIIGLWPHMHKLGQRMKLTISRADGTTELLHDAAFDFEAQLYYTADLVLRPGDSLETRCYYQNDTTRRVRFGEGTEDEMCYAFVTAWPAGSLVNPRSPLTDLRSDLADRCADTLSVLASCNGLADAL